MQGDGAYVDVTSASPTLSVPTCQLASILKFASRVRYTPEVNNDSANNELGDRR